MNHILPPKVEENSNQPQLHLYAVINGEIYKNLWVKLECEWKFQHASLFENEDLATSMNDVAPYLVYIPLHHPHISKIFKHYGYGGILFFWSEERFSKVLEKVRENFTICSSDGSKGYLTFYRIPMFNEIFKKTSKMVESFFTNREKYFCEDDLDATLLYSYEFLDNQLIRKKISLKDMS